MTHCRGVRRAKAEPSSESFEPLVNSCSLLLVLARTHSPRQGIGRGICLALFQFTRSCDTSSNISLIVEDNSAMDFTSRQFRAFLLVAQHRSFSRAAEALYITPSGLSVLIRELESQLGFRLFDRTTRHVGLTSYGRELLGVVRQSLEKLNTAVSRVGRSAAEASRTLSVGAPPLVAANILPEAIREFRTHRRDL